MGLITYKECIDKIDKSKYEIIEAPNGRLDSNRNFLKIRCKKCGYATDINLYNGNLFKIVVNQKLCRKCEKYSSKDELELRDFLFSLVDKHNVILNDKSLISPYELDIVIPSKHVAIEFNGLYWHNINAVKRGYHLNKTKMCESIGYALIHVWEDEWHCNKDKIKHMIECILVHPNDAYGLFNINSIVDRSKICKTLIPSNLMFEETDCEIIKRKTDKEYDVEDCGKLICK